MEELDFVMLLESLREALAHKNGADGCRVMVRGVKEFTEKSKET